MSKTLDQMLDDLVRVEGGYVNDPSDSGGETNFGITVGVARQNGYAGSMRDMPLETAKAIYKMIYWHVPGFDRVADRAPRVAEELFDTGVNMGPDKAKKMLQRCLRALNRMGTDYPDIAVDGDIGTGTISALTKFMAIRGAAGETVLLHALDALQGERYIEIAETNPKNEKFLYGWLANRLGNVQ